MSTVRIRNAHKFYNRGKSNELHVMNDINLELPEAGLVAIFGRSGCGKTTLLNTIGGLDKVASGSIKLFGHDIRENTDTLRNQYIGYIFQNYNLNVTETIYENVAAALRLCGLSDEREIADRVMTALRNVGLDKYSARTPDTLSGGQQQRVAIARALVKNPAIILADEPTGNLDETNTVMVMDILKEISRTHLVLLVTHEAHLVDYYCDRVIELVDGHVASDRKNEGANGYVQRNKSNIYLGELSRSETVAPGVRVEYYGEPTETLNLRIVHLNGKLYLKADNPTVKILDEGSEIRLVDGVFEATPAEGKDETHRPNLTPLPPVHGSHYGRLYHWKNALAAGWRENFSKKRKKSNRSLRVCLFLLAMVMVFMIAGQGAGIRAYSETRAAHNDALFYIPLDPNKNYSAINSAIGQHGIDYTRIIGGQPLYEGDELIFGTAAFMTGRTATLTASRAIAQSREHAEGLTLLAGTRELKDSSEILITSAIANELIESSTVGYIDGYEDLVGLINQSYLSSTWEMRSSNLRVVGVLESDEYFYYMDPMALASRVLRDNFWFPIAPLSQSVSEISLASGEAIFINNGFLSRPYTVGESFTIFGRTYKVAEVISPEEPQKFSNDKPADPAVIGGHADVEIGTEGDNLDYCIILSDADYISLSSSIGSTDKNLGFGYYDIYDDGSGYEVYYSNHLMIRSSDPASTERFLRDELGRGGFLTPSDILSESLAEQRRVAISAVVSVLVVLALMCLCVFFIMRSSFMARVREVGILRAIGVTRRNLIFRFGVETGLLLLCTLVLGYLGSSWFIASLSGAPLFSSIFYFPLWLCLGLLAFLCAASLLFGILPALLLLRKTPSEILSKYDI